MIKACFVAEREKTFYTEDMEQIEMNFEGEEDLESLPLETLWQKYQEVVGIDPRMQSFRNDRQRVIDAIKDPESERQALTLEEAEENRSDIAKYRHS